MDNLKIWIDLVRDLLWPLLVLVLVFWFRDPITKALKRLKIIEVAGLKAGLRENKQFSKGLYWYVLGQLAEESNNLKDATSHYRRAIDKDRTLSNACFSLAEVFRKQADEFKKEGDTHRYGERVGRAIELCYQAIRIEEGYANQADTDDYYLFLLASLLDMNEEDEFKHAFEEAISKQKTDCDKKGFLINYPADSSIRGADWYQNLREQYGLISHGTENKQPST